MKNIEKVKAYQEAIWDKHDIHAVDAFFAQDVLVHSPVGSTHGTAKLKSIIAQWHIGFPNLKVYWDEFICNDNTVVVRWHAQGKHEGVFLGYSPTNNEVNYVGVTIYKFSEGKVSEYQSYVDMSTIFTQLK
jgi:steroid delta-isomerase-like uncharacterized protein